MATTVESLSNAEARRIILAAQGLTRSNPFGTGPGSVTKVIEHLGYVQLDTISVVERAHHHVLWSRIPSYQSNWLELAQARHRKVFEYWAHAAAYLPMKDFRFSIPVMNAFKARKDSWPASSKSDMKKVLRRIREEGPLMSRDFESSHKGGTWWDWKPAKWALQRLFLEGNLMVSHREGFQRIYDLPERIIPDGLDTSPPSTEAYYRYLILKTLQAQGIALRNELIHLRHITHSTFDKVLKEVLEEGLMVEVRTEGNKNYFTLPAFLQQRIKVPEKFIFFSPFDNAIIWRKRLKDVFQFDYTLECYLPAHKRVYGYFCLPILFKDQFIGRVDLKAERKDCTLKVQKIIWDPGWEHFERDPLFNEALLNFAAFNQCDRLQFNA